MEIHEYAKLFKSGVVRTSKLASNQSFANLAIKRAITNSVMELLQHQFSIDNFSEYVHHKNLLERNFNMHGNGLEKDPFTLDINLGVGTFLNAKVWFLNGEYPKFVKPNNCHTNAYKFAKMYIDKCEVIFGICHTGSSFLHSVVKIKDFILDFNYNLVMSEDLYYSLFNFEVLNNVKNEDIKKFNKPLIDYITSNNIKITDAEVNACFYELIDLIKINRNLNT